MLSDKAPKSTKQLGNNMEQLPLFHSEHRRIAFTQLATFLRCPLEYRLKFIDKKSGALPSGTEISWGRLLHSIANQYLRLPTDQRSAHFLTARLHDQAASKSLPDREHQLSIFADSIRSFHQMFAQTEVYQLEVPFRATLDGFVLTGRVDALVQGQSGLVLFEFKYRDYREFDYESELDEYLELLFYSLGAKGIHVDPVEAAYYFFDSGKTASIALSESLMNRGKAHLIGIIDRISKLTDFNPTASSLCPTCGFRKQCRLYAQRS